MRAGSEGGRAGDEGAVGERGEEGEEEAEWMSRPVVKALGPAPERTMARVEGEVERWVKRGGSSCHILFGFVDVVWPLERGGGMVGKVVGRVRLTLL